MLTDKFKGLTLETVFFDQLNIGDLKFEKKGDEGSKKRPTKNDLIETKVEYLKNFRDIFGEFEYILEIIDCLSVNLKEKISFL